MRKLLLLLFVTSFALHSIEAKKQQQRVVREIHIKRQSPVGEQTPDQPAPQQKFKFRNVQQFSKLTKLENPLCTETEPSKDEAFPPREMTDYDHCVLDCKKQRDTSRMEEYVNQLRQELAIAEDVVAQNDAPQNENQDLPQDPNNRQNQRVPNNNQGGHRQSFSQPQRQDYQGGRYQGYQAGSAGQNYQQPPRTAPYQTGYRAPATQDVNQQQPGGYRAAPIEDRNQQDLRRPAPIEDRDRQQEEEPDLSAKDKVFKTVGNVYETVKNKVTGGRHEEEPDHPQQNYQQTRQ